jgi:hypothetical protein
MTDFWKIDTETYNQIQKLNKFVDFVKSLEYSSEQDKVNCKIIKDLIATIDNPETFKVWNICIDITDSDVQESLNGAKGYYWRTWAVFFEDGNLSIEASSHHTDDYKGHKNEYFSYFGDVYFKNKKDIRHIYLDTDIDLFVKDAKNYKNYIIDGLKEIEIDISI